MRSRIPLFVILLVAGSLALPFVAHAGIPFFGPIIPNAQITVNGVVTNQNVCAAGWGMLLTVINNIISLLITLAIVFVAPLMIAWSGFLFVVNPVNAGGKDEAKKILLHTVVGIVLALVGYLIVAALMAVLYDPSAVGKTWSQLITSGGAPICLPVEGSLQQSQTGVPPPAVVTPPTAVGISYTSEAQAQIGDASGPLSGLMSCMGGKVAFTVTSISDHLITPDHTRTFAQCAAGGAGCAHSTNSCHYGGVSCVGKSYAIDVRNESYNSSIITAANSCGATWVGPESTHLHVSIGQSCGCN